jgi:ubiquinone biosynthesis protein COQ9
MTDGAPDPLDGLRRDLLAAALVHVPFDGWSAISLDKAARDVGVDEGRARIAFPRGAVDLLDFFARDADDRMLARLEAMDLAAMRLRERIAAAVRARIEAVSAHREAERRALSFLALPQNAPLGARLLGRTVDLMWRAAGDVSTDFSFYTKRASLAAVHGATLLFWVADTSEGDADTWAFLERRIDDVMAVEKAKARLRERLREAPSPVALLARLRYPATTRMKP